MTVTAAEAASYRILRRKLAAELLNTMIVAGFNKSLSRDEVVDRALGYAESLIAENERRPIKK